MAQRVKGQETVVTIVANGAPQTTIADVRSTEVAFKLELLQEGYLGETTDRYDDIFKGMRGKIDLHFENQDVFTLFSLIVNRARRREPGNLINIQTTLNMPNGQRPRINIPNVFFGEIPIGFASRSDYGTIGLEFGADSADVLTA
jgi:hypothetical protein